MCWCLVQEDGSVVQRYLVQPLQQSVQAAQQQDMFVATPNGLKALVYELYGVNQVTLTKLYGCWLWVLLLWSLMLQPAWI